MLIAWGRTVAIAAIALLGTGFGAHADVIFNNFGPGDAFADSGRLLQGETVGTIGDVDQAVSFTVGGTPHFLTLISLGINASSSPNVGTGPLNIILAADAAGLPGATLRTLPLNVNVTGKQVVTVADNGTLQLDANTTYWVIADGKTTFDGGWNFNNVGDVGATAGRSNLGPWNLRPDDDRMALRVEGRPVPEPASAALLALSTVLAGRTCTRRRRR